jgi:hypothetical protein
MKSSGSLEVLYDIQQKDIIEFPIIDWERQIIKIAGLK